MEVKPYYEEPGITIYHGDCREILPQLEPVDLVLTDPPYGVGVKYGDSFKDDLGYFVEAVKTIYAIRKPTAMFFPVSRLYDLPEKPDWTGVWKKTVGFAGLRAYPFYPHWEPIAFYHVKGDFSGNKGHRDDVFTFMTAPNQNIGHPTPKPQPLINELLRFMSIFGNSVIDPFMGSGTTARAAKDFKKNFIGIEIEQKYCDIAIERLKQGVLI